MVFYYQNQKKSVKRDFFVADSVFQSEDYLEARQHYEELKNAQYLTPENDSLLYVRLDTIEAIEDAQLQIVRRAREAATKPDSAIVLKLISRIEHPELLPEDDLQWIKNWKSPEG